MKNYLLTTLFLFLGACTTDSTIDLQIEKYMNTQGQSQIESVVKSELEKGGVYGPVRSDLRSDRTRRDINAHKRR